MSQKKEPTHRDIRDALIIDCPIRNVLARVGDKWSLTQTLRTLKEDGFLSRDIINMRMIKMCILYKFRNIISFCAQIYWRGIFLKSMFLAIQLNFRLVIDFIITKLAEYFYRAAAI